VCQEDAGFDRHIYHTAEFVVYSMCAYRGIRYMCLSKSLGTSVVCGIYAYRRVWAPLLSLGTSSGGGEVQTQTQLSLGTASGRGGFGGWVWWGMRAHLRSHEGSMAALAAVTDEALAVLRMTVPMGFWVWDLGFRNVPMGWRSCTGLGLCWYTAWSTGIRHPCRHA
jgi:hypothetical protein